MKFTSYPRYKDSGIDWLGKVPEHWRVKKFKYLFKPSDERNGESIVGKMLSVSGYRGIVIKAYEDENQKRTEENLRDYRVVRPGQLVVNTMWLNYAGLGVSRYEGHVSPAYRAYYISEEINGWFAHHLLRSSVYVSGYTKYLQGIRPNSLQIKTEEFHSFRVLLPPIEEQTAIANFLDNETAKIDTLIGKQEWLIALLQEKRHALISNAVTKGLNVATSMKDSGIKWLGEIPAHWEVKRLKHIAQVRGGIAKGRDLSGQESVNLPYMRVANIQDGHIDLSDVATIEILKSEVERYLLRKGDMLMNEGGDNDKLGRGAVWKGDIDPCVHQNHVFAVRPFKVESEWLALITRTHYAKFYFFLNSVQSTNLASISSSNVKQLPIVFPPISERKKIYAHIESTITSIDNLLQKAERQIYLLQEHRSALISAAVTGKIDVRQYRNGNLSNY